VLTEDCSDRVTEPWFVTRRPMPAALQALGTTSRTSQSVAGTSEDSELTV